MLASVEQSRFFMQQRLLFLSFVFCNWWGQRNIWRNVFLKYFVWDWWAGNKELWSKPSQDHLKVVCFLAKISLHRPTCKTTFASLTQSQAISQSFRVFISFRSMRDTTFFHSSKLFFIQNYRFLYHGDQKISWWTLQVAGSQLRNPPVKFRQERWLHLAIDQHPACPNRGRLELWPRKWFLLGQNPWRWACWSIYSL